jgi:hypothetical protein
MTERGKRVYVAGIHTICARPAGEREKGGAVGPRAGGSSAVEEAEVLNHEETVGSLVGELPIPAQ